MLNRSVFQHLVKGYSTKSETPLRFRRLAAIHYLA
jgi:hypothetical protein